MSPGPKSHPIIPVKKDFPLDNRPKGIPRSGTGNIFNKILTDMIKNPVIYLMDHRVEPNPNLSALRAPSGLTPTVAIYKDVKTFRTSKGDRNFRVKPTLKINVYRTHSSSSPKAIARRNIRDDARIGTKTVKAVGFPKGVAIANL